MLHDDPQVRHRAVPPDRRVPDMGLHQPPQFPFGTSKCATIRCSIRAPLGCRARRILDEEMHHVCPHRQWQDRTEPGGQEIIPGRPSLPKSAPGWLRLTEEHETAVFNDCASVSHFEGSEPWGRRVMTGNRSYTSS